MPEFDRLLSTHQAALGARAYRTQVLASNIANADTPGYQARDVDFKAALTEALGMPGAQSSSGMLRTSTRHLGAGGSAGGGAGGAGGAMSTPLIYRTVTQASIDNNTVDINVERAQFADNAMRYEASLTFINAKIKAMLAAIQS
jgi:flagellar basal-body rod protein FlgB